MEPSVPDTLIQTAITYAPELKRFFKGRVSDAHDAQDLMQELYLALLKVPVSQVIRHPKAYLFTIAGNLVHQHWQRSRAKPTHVSFNELPAEVFHGAPTAPEANISEFALTLAERLSEVEERLSELSPKIQAAVVWHHRDGYTCDEIARKLSVVRHRVKKYLVKGMTHCRAGYDESDTRPLTDVREFTEKRQARPAA